MKNKYLACLLFIFCLLSNNLLAQVKADNDLPVGPYTYAPPEGTVRYSKYTPSIDYISICMNQLSPLSPTDDGLMVAWEVNLDLKKDEGVPLIAFSDNGGANNLIEIKYSKRTITARRYNIVNGKRVSYDYHSFDPLFKDTTGIVTWRIQVYFTSSFMYIVAKDRNSPYRYMSPFYFGLDIHRKYPDTRSVMYKFVNRDVNAYILLGSMESEATINNITISSFVYSAPSAQTDWWRTMQREFSSPNPPQPNN